MNRVCDILLKMKFEDLLMDFLNKLTEKKKPLEASSFRCLA